jgi:hypothetical protein
MNQIRLRQDIVLPLFGVAVSQPFETSLDLSAYDGVQGCFRLKHPIQIYPRLDTSRDSTADAPLIESTTSLPAPKVAIRILPWKDSEVERKRAMDIAPLASLPADFDLTDGLGEFAVRSATGQMLGFRVGTTFPSKQRAQSLLILTYTQIVPDANLLPNGSPYELLLTDSILDALRLYFAVDLVVPVAFQLIDGKFNGRTDKWPHNALHAHYKFKGTIDAGVISNLSILVWSIRSTQSSQGSRVVLLALQEYFLAAIQFDIRDVFLHLMVAFECLFKRSDEKISMAAPRIGNLLGVTAKEAKDIGSFIDDNGDSKLAPGCSRVRNNIVHGREGVPSETMAARLRELIRGALIELVRLVLSDVLARSDYYKWLDEHCTWEARPPARVLHAGSRSHATYA